MSRPVLKECYRHTTIPTPYKYYPSAIPDLSPTFVRHWHNEFEINYIVKGMAVFSCENKSCIAKKGDIFVFLPNQIHGMTPLEENKIYYDTLLFRGEIFGNSEERLVQKYIYPLNEGVYSVQTPISEGDNGYERIKETIETIFCSVKQGDILQDILFKSKLLELFYLLYVHGYISEGQVSKVNYSTIVRPALRYIEEHFSENITVEELAESIPLSKSYFMNCFKKATGMGTIEYITQMRIKHACEKLMESDKTIMQIAFESGFRNLSNFNRLFKKNVGCSPGDYKKRISNISKK